MNEFDELDRELSAAFAQRPSTLSRPSLRDVRQRARRRQRQRQAGVLSACAVVGIGGVAVIATRSPGNRTTIGVGDSQPTNCGPTTIVNETVITAPNTVPQTTITFSGTYVLQAGDFPGSVAEKFGVTVADLDAVNRHVPGYGGFLVGTVILIPGPGTPVTNPVDDSDVAGSYTIAEGDYPGKVAEMFGVTVRELDAVNEDVPGYGGFIVGTVIRIPFSTTGTTVPLESAPTTTTLFPIATSTSIPEVTCEPAPSEPTVSTIVLAPNETQPVTVIGESLPVFDMESASDAAVGLPAPTLSGYDFQGVPVNVDPSAVGPYLLVFAAHWCPHCNAQMPTMNGWRSGGVPAELNVVGISTAVSPSSSNHPPSAWFLGVDWAWPVLADESQGDGMAGVAAEAFGANGWPFFVLIGSDGLVKARFAGQMGVEELRSFVEAASSSTTTTISFPTKQGTVIQVANCSNQEGVAGLMSYALAAEGFTMAEPDTCTIDLARSKILYNPDDPLALPVAQTLALYLGNVDVEPSGPVVPTLTTGTWIPGSSVLVLLGNDLAGKTLAQIAGEQSSTSTTQWTTTTAS